MSQQILKTQNALTFLSGLGEVGIIGLVDEATAYQEIRAKRALATILTILCTSAGVLDELKNVTPHNLAVGVNTIIIVGSHPT